MASCEKMNPDSDDEPDLEALRLAALRSRHEKSKHVNHSNLIPIVPVNVVTPIVANPKIKLEPISPTLEENIRVDSKLNDEEEFDFEDEGDKDSSESENDQENDQDILGMDDKEEEDSLERLMDQLEAEISGNAPIPSNRTVIASKKLSDKSKKKKVKKKKDQEVEVELVQVKIGKQQGPVINIRESASPEATDKRPTPEKKTSPRRSNSPNRRSRTPFRSRSGSPFRRSRSLRRSRSPYWSKSPRRSKSPYRRSRSPPWIRHSRSPLRSRSPFRHSRSPLPRRQSPFRRYSRSRSRSYVRRSRSPWSHSPRRRSRSPFRDSLSPLPRRRNAISPDGRFRRRSLSPRGASKSPRRRSRSPRRLPIRRNSYRRSKSPYRRSRSPLRRLSPRRGKSPLSRRTPSPIGRHSKSPVNTFNSPSLKRRSPLRSSRSPIRGSKSPLKRSASPRRLNTSKSKSKSPTKKFDSPSKRTRRSLSRGRRSLSFSASPTPRRNRSPLRVVERNKVAGNDKLEKGKERVRTDKNHRSLSRDRRPERRFDRRPYKPRGFRRFSPSRDRKSPDRQKRRSRSPKKKENADNKEADVSKAPVEDKGTSPVPMVPVDPVLEARKKKFETLSEVDPSVDKKISLKSVKESTNLEDDDEDALNINLESDLWDESEESDNECEGRFKSADAKKKTNRTVLSFRNLRDDGGANKKINLNKPLIEDNRRDRYNRNDRFDRWQRGRRNDRNDRNVRTNRNYSRYHDDNQPKQQDDRTSKSKVQEPAGNHDVTENKNRKVMFSGKDKLRNQSDVSKDNEASNVVNSSEISDTRTRSEVISSEKTADEKPKSDNLEDDEFYKLMSDFERELESDLCLPNRETNQSVRSEQTELQKPKISVKKDLFEPKLNADSSNRKVARPSEISSTKTEKENRFEENRRQKEEREEGEINDQDDKKSEPEDYIEDDDFVLEDRGEKRKPIRLNEDDSQSDLRAVLSRRRNERLTKVVTVQEKMPNRLVQSAFQGLGNKKLRKAIREVQSSVELPLVDAKPKPGSTERRRVLVLRREKKTPVQSIKVTVPEVKPDTTTHRLNRLDDRKKKRKLQRHGDGVEDLDQEEENEEFEPEEKPPRRIRLKRNVTLSSQVGVGNKM